MRDKIEIDSVLVKNLIAEQFPQWKDLPIRPVSHSGWDNRTFHLGENMLVRLPSAACYEGQVEKEHLWLPKLAPHLPCAWNYFNKDARSVFKQSLSTDSKTWARGRGWALWKALIVAAKWPGTNPDGIAASMRTIEEILRDQDLNYEI